MSIIDLCETAKLGSRNFIRNLIKSNGLYINMELVDSIDRKITNDDLIHGKYIVLRQGKKKLSFS